MSVSLRTAPSTAATASKGYFFLVVMDGIFFEFNQLVGCLCLF